MGPSAVDQLKLNSDGTVNLPKNMSDEVLASRAKSILQQSSIDKAEVALATDGSSSDRVVFHNGAGGSIRVKLGEVPQILGFAATLSKTELAADENAELVLSYTPPKGQEPPAPFTVQLVTEPFNQTFAIKVSVVSVPERPKFVPRSPAGQR
jgi:hypothetical protein